MGIYRDSTRSSRSFFVKSSGLRYLSLQLLVKIRWVLVRDPQGVLDPQVFLCTDPKLSASAILL